jgi:hypothetical protein
MKTDNKGQADLAITIATLAVVLVVVVIVLGQLTANLGNGLTGNALAAYGNVTSYAWTGIQLTAIGIIIVAGFGLIGMMMFRH